ncbi:hypothetical protein QJS10_CPB13g00240 [Acorus calamus]|uniref:Uncharacterized protein n=1 Tax=Acorus calamus TaxID=4465 RepID=A0AAV9DH68_ACOCL|nr:hypothetical protein QJS10_CPB13g00240 [Acorus calamus]
MNIVKGVTDLIRRTSGGQTGEGGSSSSAGKFSAPSLRIRFGEIGDEAVLHTLWQRYENAIDKVLDLKGPVSEARFHWQQKAITLVMETGGLNWLVGKMEAPKKWGTWVPNLQINQKKFDFSIAELLRVIRRLNMKAQWTEISLQYLTLVTLRSALSGNPRAQNHFRSIGGLEVLLDGLGLPSSNYIVSRTAFQFSNERFGNLYNLQFLCENGRVHKFANSICWPAFMVQEFQQHMLGLSISGSRMISQISTADVHEDENFASESCFSGQSDGNAFSNWSAYAAKLSQALCSFLLTPEDVKVHQLQGSVGQSSMSASISYWELAVKWFMKVLFTLFPCIKACSNQTVLPSHIRKLLISSATLFEVFRQEGIWDLIFSESFFYFKGVSEEISGKSEASLDESDIIQMEVISFLEFAATLTGNTHNVPECSALLDALEQSSCNPEIASVLVKSLHRILQLSNEQTISSFKTLGAIARILKVACIQAEEFRKLKAVNPSSGIAPHLEISPKDLQKISSYETAEVLVQSMAASMEIFTEFVSVADNARKTFNHAKEREKDFVQLSIDLLVGMRDVVLIDPSGAFKVLVGAGYQTLQNLLLDICHWQPTSGLLDALLDMLVDGKFSIDKNPVIKFIQIVGGHSISGKDIRRIFALLRSEKIGSSEMYAKINDLMTHCTIGKFDAPPIVEENSPGPVEVEPSDAIRSGVFDAKDGLASKIIFGLNAQASDGRNLFNVSSMIDHVLDKNIFEAKVMAGTQLCSRRLLQQIIYCVGGVSVFFPLLTQFDGSEEENGQFPPEQLNIKTVTALKHMLDIVRNCGLSELLMKDAISKLYLNPHIWYFENDARLLTALCGLPRIIDIIRQFYWDKLEGRSAFGSKPLLHPTTGRIIGERPGCEEIHKIRLLLLSLVEMSLRQEISASDIKSLVAFFEKSQDMVCIEDVLHMVIRALSRKELLASFIEQVNMLGGGHIFVNVLGRELEPIRLLGLQFIGKLLVGLPSEKKGQRFFNLTGNRSKSLTDNQRKANLHLQAFYQAVAEKLFKYPLSDHLCATLFDVLLGGASPKQVLQKRSQSDNYQSRQSGSTRTSSHFLLPQILVLIFKFLGLCEDSLMRKKVLGDLLNLLDSNPSNIEALMEYGWNSWLETSLKFGVFKNHKVSEIDDDISEERNLVRNVFSLVLSHYMYSIKGGYLQFEETVNFLLLQSEQVCRNVLAFYVIGSDEMVQKSSGTITALFLYLQGELSSQILLRTIIEDLIGSLVDLSSDENIFVLQPCRDNTLYLLKLADEMLISELGCELLFPISSVSADHSSDFLELERQKDIKSAIIEALNGDADGQLLKQRFYLVSIPTNHLGGFSDNCRSQGHESFISSENDVPADQWWKLYDKLWVLICAMNGKGPSKIYSRTSTTGGPSFGQRARGLVESLNIPAAEMAAVVVSGSIGNALGGKTSKGVDKVMLLRGEKCPRIIFRLVILYLSKSVLERASKCVQQFISLLPCLLASDDEHSKITTLDRSLLATRKLSGMLDDGARFQLISHLIRETVNFGKSVIATSILGREDSSDASSSMKEISSISNLIQKERLLVAVVDEVRFMKTVITDRSKQLQEFHVRMDEAVSMDITQRKMFDDENCINLEAILSSDDSRRVASQLAYDEDQQIVAEKWIHMFRALIDERGPWSAYSFPNEIVTHWKLDKTEDLWRRRPKLRRNYHFDEKLCHPPTITCNTATHLNESHSGTGSHFPEQMKHFLLKGVRGITEEVSLESIEDDTELSGMTSSLDKSSESEALDVVKDSKDQTDTALDRKDQSSSTAETEFSNEVLLSIPSVLITPKRKLAGRLAVMRHVLHFFGEFLVEGTGGSSVFKNFSDLINHGSTKSEQLTVLHKQKLQKFSLATVNTLPDNLVQDQQRKIKRHRRWNVGKIKAVHWTRYLLQYTAIEIFFHDSVAPVFLNFASQKDAKDAGMLIVSKRNELLSPKGNLKDKNGAISFIDRRIAVEMAENARDSWRRREMSNFEYLMVLNTLAGRSYNDLTQYPVFPWVLADYSSEKLDFNKSSTFRDLSKPVGALDIKRFEGGKFDHADRLFQSIEGTYRNCLSNTSDVKELIPEFFYMPEFLTNSNSYHLGVKQDGEPLGDVSLPPWAKGSLEEFIYKNREALESEYVSSNLHHWIDLVFGYKQRGKPAVEAANIFYYLTYEGAVDMDAMEDESQRLAIEDQIANFGQTPIQIFRKKHPRRGPPIPIAHPLYFAPASITLTSMISISSSAIQYIGTMESNIVLIDQSLTMSVKMWLSMQMQSGGNFTFSGLQEPFFGIGSDVLTRKVGIPLAENIELGAQCFTTLQTPNENFMVLCGNWENSFQVISLNDGRMVQNIRQHKDVVSCLAVSSDGSVLATGSYDTTVMVWEVSHARMTEKRFRNAQSELPRRDYVIVENPVHILCGHDDIITCLYVSVELDIVISGSRDGTCIFHTLRDGKYVRSIRHPSNGPLSRLAASQHGRVVFYADNDLSLHMHSINGKHIVTSESNGRINCVAISSCGEFLVCAGDHGHIFLRSMHSLDIVKRYDGVGKIITSLTVTPEECFLAGTKDGNLLIYSIENPQLRRGSLQRNMKSKSYARG